VSNIVREFQGHYRFLSNFWWYNGTTVEHQYQAAKAVNEADRQAILRAKTPGEAKRLGGRVIKRQEFDGQRLVIMKRLLEQKFAVPELRRKLLDTGDAILQEGNTWGDLFWGIDLKTDVGENHLGKLLMEIRQNFVLRLCWNDLHYKCK